MFELTDKIVLCGNSDGIFFMYSHSTPSLTCFINSLFYFFIEGLESVVLKGLIVKMAIYKLFKNDNYYYIQGVPKIIGQLTLDQHFFSGHTM